MAKERKTNPGVTVHPGPNGELMVGNWRATHMSREGGNIINPSFEDGASIVEMVEQSVAYKGQRDPVDKDLVLIADYRWRGSEHSYVMLQTA